MAADKPQLTVRQALQAMGYREMKPGTWGKPVGFVLFTFEEDTNTLTNWFRAVTGEVMVYNANKLTPDAVERYGSPLYQIKEFECFARTDVSGVNSQFEFMTLEEVVGEQL